MEAIKVQTSIIQNEIQSLKPDIGEHLKQLRLDYTSLSNSLSAIREQVTFLTKICANIQSQSRDMSSLSDDADLSDETFVKPKVKIQKERLLTRPTEMPKRRRLVNSEETRL